MMNNNLVLIASWLIVSVNLIMAPFRMQSLSSSVTSSLIYTHDKILHGWIFQGVEFTPLHEYYEPRVTLFIEIIVYKFFLFFFHKSNSLGVFKRNVKIFKLLMPWQFWSKFQKYSKRKGCERNSPKQLFPFLCSQGSLLGSTSPSWVW